MKSLQFAVEENNLQGFLQFGLRKEDILCLRFKHSLNILQAVSYFGAEKILKYIKEVFKEDSEARDDLVMYQEPHGGNMAIHFAVLKGNKRIIDSLISDFNANPTALTSNGLSVLHCAA